MLYNCITNYGARNVNFAPAQQAKGKYQYKDIKEKLHETNAAICHNNTRRKRQQKLDINSENYEVRRFVL